MFKRLLLGTVLFLASASVGRADFLSLSDLQVVVGSGSNEAGFVVDWNDGGVNHSLAWGYRWNGTATAEDMLRALAASPLTGIYATLGDFGPGLGFAVFGIGVDLNQNGTFGVTPTLTFTNGIATLSGTTGLDESRQPTDPGDLYREGWFTTGYWNLWSKANSTDDWVSSNVGMSSLTLTDGSWIGWGFANDFNVLTPADPIAATPIGGPPPTATPAPGALVLLITAAPVVLGFRRRKAPARA
ncbi:hypothetical protein [Fimbriiglobus ruber]|uniref:PEP-CTERM protein-sorting domain-containing protein n=1 Tax=Fimbriiglobus ruber TaxID=1908690 RepID=A0A225DII8_9BACT|nr:hypothetical protein [Fimbriiglobus ruber]OWK41261.1 hypothetical protein FRUB_04624 [Fimbriiglobus ruber]